MTVPGDVSPDLTGRGALSTSRPAIDAIIVNWNGRRFLPRCLASLERSTVPVRILVVDNGSDDGSVEYVRAEHPGVEVLAVNENLGYAAGANAGLRATAGEYAIILNADVHLAPDHLAILKARLDGAPAIGAAQGKLYRVRPDDFLAGRFDVGGVLDSAGHAIRRSRMVVDRGQGRPDGPAYSREASVFSACGAALFLRRSMLEDVAPDGEYFDSAFFAYKEDIDLCWRARILGWDIRYVPGALAWHVRGWAGGRVPRRRARPPLAARRNSWKNHYLLMLKNDLPGDIARALPFVGGWELLRQGYALLRDPALYPAYGTLARQLPDAMRRRRELLGRRRTAPSQLRRWFGAPAMEPGVPGPEAQLSTASREDR
ncbi:MAG TPA: glycosyltransferase family 2 protein [Longimicrobiales bacterium]